MTIDFDSLHHPKIRELTFQAYFAFETMENDPKLLIALLMKQLKMTKRHVKSAVERALNIIESKKQIESFLSKADGQFDLSAIRNLESVVLHYAIYELCIDPIDTQKHVINEMVRITKKFHNASFAKYVNALLDYLYKNQDKEDSSPSSAMGE